MLEVKASGSKSWVVRLQFAGRRRDFGLGSTKDVSLEQARDAAREYRRLVKLGRDPVVERRRQHQPVPSFEVAAKEVHSEQKATWRNAKHKAQWLQTLETFAFPTIGELPVDQVNPEHVRDLLSQIWLMKPETARRVRQRIGAVLDYAQGKGWRDAAFPMTVVSRALPKQVRRVSGFKALPYPEIPDLVAKLRERTSMGRLALEALILTAARSGEIRNAVWCEFDLRGGKWVRPASKMKGGKDHSIPLSSAAVAVFKRGEPLRSPVSDLVFPGYVRKRPLSDMTLLKVLRDAGVDATVHGFRSAFRDWCAEKSGVPGEVAEAALAHTNPNKVEARYRRTDFFELRVPLMEQWGRFCVSKAVAAEDTPEPHAGR